ncbi:MAG: hypothetical protein H0Z38_04270 [Firmicutes bacterium]|nr:hypothetical protein [Bacillota bacterium]
MDPALSPDGTTIAYVKIKPYAKAASSTTPVRAPGRFLRGSL